MGDVLRCITFISVTGDKYFTALKVPRQCPLVRLVKWGWKQSRSSGSEKRSVLEVEFCECTAEGKKVADWSWILCLRVSIMTKFCSRCEGWGFGENFEVCVEEGCMRRTHLEVDSGTNSAFGLGLRKTKEKIHWFGRSQDWFLASSPTFKCTNPNMRPYFIFNKYTDVYKNFST